MILTDEFSRQASMEQDLGIPSALFAAPVREVIELGKSQLGFMNMFAIPLFQGVTDVMPGMEFCVDELHRNKERWEEKIAEEQTRARLDSVDSRMMDGMFSPRTMSIATPSDASHQKPGSTISPGRSNTDSSLRIKAMLSKSPFAQSKHIPDESAELGHYHSMPEISTKDLLDPDSENPSPSQVSPDSSSRRSSRPTQLQLSYATSSAPSLLEGVTVGLGDASSDEKETQLNGVDVKPSHVRDPVLISPTTDVSEAKTESKQRTSDTTNSTESSAGGGGDWTSQATSATTNKMPLSPSTKGTSIMSEEGRSSLEKGDTPTGQSPLPSNNSRSQITNSTTGKAEAGILDGKQGQEGEGDGKGALLESVRNLKKKPSRFRMNSLNFWKRSKSSSPPVPSGRERRVAVGGDGVTGEGEGSS
jgi:3',5'-cyclic-nucleotide phosphodiesterase